MIKLIKSLEKLKGEMFEEFSELKGNDKELEIVSNDYLKMILNYKESVQTLSILFTDEESYDVRSLLETMRMIACYKYTKYEYKRIFENE